MFAVYNRITDLLKEKTMDNLCEIHYVNRADPSWSIERKIAWLKRREYLRNHKDAVIPDDRPKDKEFHRWWHTKGKYQTMKHYVDGQQPIY
jgi:hypothetical protein